MSSSQTFCFESGRQSFLRLESLAAHFAILAVMCLGIATTVYAQVTQSAEKGGIVLSAGGAFSGYYVGFGERKMLGPTVFVDFGSRSALGIEAEARWLDLRETAGVHDATYLAGPRYSFPEMGRFRPYAKLLVGDGEFTFAYNLAHGSYFVIAPGAGLEYQLNRRVTLRLADFEYQYWNQFTYGSLPSYGVSSGLRVHIF